jgi:hypothetical protein
LALAFVAGSTRLAVAQPRTLTDDTMDNAADNATEEIPVPLYDSLEISRRVNKQPYTEGPGLADPSVAPPNCVRVPPDHLICPCKKPGDVDCSKHLIRFKHKPTADDFAKATGLPPSHFDPECLTCVVEPFLCPCEFVEPTEVVLFGCVERTKPFGSEHCEDGKWCKKTGEKTCRQVEPCKRKINIKYTKLVVEYYPVWIYVPCHH